MSGRTLAEVLAEHERKFGTFTEPQASLGVHCMCGWKHPDRFVQNSEIYRQHVADAVTAWIEERLTGAREDVAEALFEHTDGTCAESDCGDGFGYNDVDSHEERRSGCGHLSSITLAAVREALGIDDNAGGEHE